ncbi:MAG: M1 family metallopeptidase [Planctomycetes bacterium]|nr:M1 family metallopeptidase [Planctomycetota bacterium]
MNRRRPVLFFLASFVLAALALGQGRRPIEPDPPCRADYAIQVRYEEAERALVGSERIQWHNTTRDDVPDLWFHLYWNGFANNRSTHLSESGGELRGVELSDEWGWQRVTALRVRDQDRTASIEWRPVDDGRAEDKTVFRVKLDPPARPDEVVTIHVDWEARVPRVRRRTGYKDDFLFIAHWFPKLGVYEGGIGWNCHQFHAMTEFFSDYGVYDVRLDLPAKYAGKIGASGVQVEPDAVADGRVVARFVAPSPIDQRTPDSTGKLPLVHDFTWTADPKYVKRAFRFQWDDWAPRYEAEVDRVALALGRSKDEIRLRDVDVTVLLQPEHADQDRRHFEATSTALFFYGLWFGEYPYEHMTCVDPAWGGGAAGGMEYPTLFTAGSRMHTFPRMHSPESVTVHECGHQFWYGLVGNNEFEAAWMDEGFNTFTQNEAIAKHYGGSARTTEYAGLYFDGAPVAREPGGGLVGDLLAARRIPAGSWKLEPLPASGVLDWWKSQPLLTFSRGTNDPRWNDRNGYLADPDSDPVDTFGWRYVDSQSYRQNSYRRTAVNLRSLQGMVGEERFLRGMRTYSERYRYAHPYADDFFDAFSEGAQADAAEFFEQAFRSTATVDWSVEVRQRKVSEPAGWFLDAKGEWVKREKAAEPSEKSAKGWLPDVLVRRKGVLYLPLELQVGFEDGTHERFLWSVDEQRRASWWRPIEAGTVREKKVVSAVLDPKRVYFLDLDMSNNQWYEATSVATPVRWSERVLSQCSQLLHFLGGLGG